MCATLKVEKPVTATLSFFVPQELAWSIAQNIYGPEDLSMELVTDMITELLNTIAGKFISRILPDQEFELTIPQLTDVSLTDQAAQFHYFFNIDNQGTAAITLQP